MGRSFPFHGFCDILGSGRVTILPIYGCLNSLPGSRALSCCPPVPEEQWLCSSTLILQEGKRAAALVRGWAAVQWSLCWDRNIIFEQFKVFSHFVIIFKKNFKKCKYYVSMKNLKPIQDFLRACLLLIPAIVKSLVNKTGHVLGDSYYKAVKILYKLKNRKRSEFRC